MNYKLIEYEEKGSVAWICVNRPQQMNALCNDLVDELLDVFERIDNNENVRVAVITGKGKAFIAGADLKELSQKDAFEYMSYGAKLTNLGRVMRENSKVIIGLANGYALGGGNVIILSCDMIIASENAKFSMAEVNVGIFGGAALLTKLFGKYKAAEYCLLGEQYTAQTAYELGAIYKITSEDRLLEEAQILTDKLLAKSPQALKYAKRALSAGLKYDLDAAYDYQTALMSILFSGPEQKEGMQAFIEKRRPNYDAL